jgi:murein L,D-transpeptidase YafK
VAAVLLALAGAIVVWSLSAGRELPAGARADRIVVEKHTHTLTLYQGDSPLKTYRVALGRGGAGPKMQAGDNKVPEGTYRIIGRNSRSEFHRSLRVGYPTPEQKRVDAREGVTPGGDIMVHGIRNGLAWMGPLHRTVDWTRGCVALTDSEMDEVWRAVPDGTTIEIRP